MEEIQAILAKVEVLPTSPTMLPKLLPYLGDVNANFEDVVEIISLEQTLTAKLLQICNSAFFGQEEPVSTVAEAVNRVLSGHRFDRRAAGAGGLMLHISK